MELLATSQGLVRIDGDDAALLDLPYRDVGQLLQQGSMAQAREAASWMRIRRAEAIQAALPLFGSAPSIWGVGANYWSKMAATGRPAPSEPLLFLKASSAVVASGDPILLPRHHTIEVDYEGEVAVVIGKLLWNAHEKEVLSSIAGVTAAIDVTARDVMTDTGSPTVAKSFRSFSPLGRTLLDAATIEAMDCIALETRLNGTVVQRGNTSDLVFSIPALLARLSTFAALEPGDVVLTGTPAGTGQDRGSYLKPDDELMVTVAEAAPLYARVRKSQ